MGSFVKIGSIRIDLSKYDHQDTHNCESSNVRDNVSEKKPSSPTLEASHEQTKINNNDVIDLTKDIVIDPTDDIIDLTGDDIIDLTDDNVIDLTGDDIIDLTDDNVIDLTDNNVIDLTNDEDIHEDIGPLVKRTASKISKKGKRKLNRVSRKSALTMIKEDDAINEDDKPLKMHFLSKIVKELKHDETTCHPNEVVVEKCMISKKSRRKSRKTQVPWDERCKNAENLVLTTKEEPIVNDNESNLVGGIVISKPMKIETECMWNVSINNDDAKSNVLHKRKGKMIQTNVESDSSSFAEDNELRLALHNSLIFQYPLQFGEGTSKSFLEGTNSRSQFNIEEGYNENSLEYFHIPNNIQKNSVPTKENDCRDVTHYDDDALMHEIADILANILPYSVEHEKGLMGNSICLEANGEKAKFEKRSISKIRSKNKRNTKRRKYGKD